MDTYRQFTKRSKSVPLRLLLSSVVCIITILPVAAQEFTHTPSANVTFPLGTAPVPEDTVLGDFDGDNELDVAIANTHFGQNPQTGSVSVLFNNGDGTFEQLLPIETVVGLRTEGITAADFDNDGYDDIAAANFASGEVSVLLSNGASRSFGSPTDFIPNHPCRHVRAALIDNDTDYDLMTANHDDDTLSVFLGNGDGTFSLQSAITIVGDGPETVAFGNVNGDAWIDVIITNAQSDNVSVLLGQGDGTFSLGALVPTLDDEPRFAVAHDFNGDGRDDFVTSHFRGQDTVKVFQNDGDGTSFTNVFTDPTTDDEDSPIFQAVGDLNNDGDVDIAVSFFGVGDNIVRFYEGDGAFGFVKKQDIPVGNRPYGLIIHDFDNDNANDLMTVQTADGNVVFRFGTPVAVADPVAHIDSISPNPAVEGTQVSFSGHGTPQAEIVSVEWRSNLVGPKLSSQASFSTTSLPVGNHTISFRVEKAGGQFDVASSPLTITALPDPPMAFIDSIDPSPAPEGASVTFLGHGEPLATITAYEWRSNQVTEPLSSKANFSSALLEPGTHTITLRVEGAGGLFDETSTDLQIIATVPSVTIQSIGPSPVTEGETVEFTGSATPEEFAVGYLWRSSLVVTDLSEQPSFATDTLPPGTHTIYFSARNEQGEWSPEAEATLVVKPRPVATIASISPSPATVGEAVSFVGTATPPEDIVGYRWRMGTGDQISDVASFSSDALPIGLHTILFSARNDLGVWSDEDSLPLQVDSNLEEDIFVDNGAEATETIGRWNVSSGLGSFLSKSLYSSEEGSTYRFKPPISQSGRYEVFLRWTPFANRHPAVPVEVEHDEGATQLALNQTQNSGEWVSLGTYQFTTVAQVTIRSVGLGSTTSVDGLRLRHGGF